VSGLQLAQCSERHAPLDFNKKCEWVVNEGKRPQKLRLGAERVAWRFSSTIALARDGKVLHAKRSPLAGVAYSSSRRSKLHNTWWRKTRAATQPHPRFTAPRSQRQGAGMWLKTPAGWQFLASRSLQQRRQRSFSKETNKALPQNRCWK
jgi:hypothetical protein